MNLETLGNFLLILIGFTVFFVSLWVFVLFIISLVGGWARLATCYRAPGPFEGPQWHLQSGHLSLTRYKGVLTFGADREGLYLATFLLFRISHPPLWIPWSEITMTESHRFLFMHMALTFAQVPGVTLYIPRRISERITAARDGLPLDM